jgi:hypothetical protein
MLMRQEEQSAFFRFVRHVRVVQPTFIMASRANQPTLIVAR